MIARYRNKGFIQLACAVAMTALLVFLYSRWDRRSPNDNIVILLVFLYFACWVLWMVASFTLAKAKGYSTDLAGGIFLFLIVVGFCFPIAALLFPIVVLFGLNDKTRERLRRF